MDERLDEFKSPQKAKSSLMGKEQDKITVEDVEMGEQKRNNEKLQTPKTSQKFLAFNPLLHELAVQD